MDFFESVEGAPLDSILGLSVSFAADQKANKVNLGAGVYKTADLKPYILNAVKKAEALLLDRETSKDYLPIDGLPAYVQQIQNLVFGSTEGYIYGAQTTGGTAALRLGGRFLEELGLRTIYLSTPTWDNHQRIFRHAGLQVESYPYINWKREGLDFEHLIEALQKMEKRSIVLFQVCCHNPTGVDPTLDQWKEIFKKMEERELFPFFDFAYQGFGDGLEQDASVLRLFMQSKRECMVAVSHAKNFGLYAERCGALFVVCQNKVEAERVGSRIKVIIRGLYSNPPCHGVRIITTILEDAELKAEWRQELEGMRTRITQMRKSFAQRLEGKTPLATLDSLSLQKGMFSYTGLSEKHVEKLTADYGIYMPKDGRINVAGLNGENLGYVTDAIIEVTHASP